MSTVRADNFGNRAGTSQIPADTLLQGTAKSWLNMIGTGAIAVRDSFNVSSLIDQSTGQYNVNTVTPFANGLYAVLACGYPTAANYDYATGGTFTLSRYDLFCTTLAFDGTPSRADLSSVYAAAFTDPT